MIWNTISYLFVSYDNIMNQIVQGFGKYDSRSCSMCANCNSNFGIKKYGSDLIQESIIIQMRGQEYKVPKQYEKLLEILYGDYMKYADIKERIKEVLIHYNYLEKHGKK